MQKIVINVCYGGFGLSEKALELYVELYNERMGTDHTVGCDIESRTCPTLIQIVEEMGEKSWGMYSELKIVEIPDGVEWEIDECDGNEWVAEKHRTWR